MKVRYKLPIVIEFNAFELGQIIGATYKHNGYQNFTPSLKRKITRTINKIYKDSVN